MPCQRLAFICSAPTWRHLNRVRSDIICHSPAGRSVRLARVVWRACHSPEVNTGKRPESPSPAAPTPDPRGPRPTGVTYESELHDANELFNEYATDVWWPYFMRGIVHWNFRQPALAAVDLDKAVRMGLPSAEARFFLAAALFRAGCLDDAKLQYRRLLIEEMNAVGNPYGLAAEFRERFGHLTPAWSPPGKLFQRGVCLYFCGAYDDAYRSLRAALRDGIDHVNAGNEDRGDEVTWDYIIWRELVARKLKPLHHRQEPMEREILEQLERQGKQGVGAIELVRLFLERDPQVLSPEVQPTDPNHIIRREFYLALYADLGVGDGVPQPDRAREHYGRALQQVPEVYNRFLYEIDDMEAFLVDVARWRLRELDTPLESKDTK